MVEFALVSPIAILSISGIIIGSLLFFQNAALHDGATAGSRMAEIETSLAATPGGTPSTTCAQFGESGSPQSIEKAVANAMPNLKVNSAALCATTSTATQLTQGATIANQVNITVTASPNISNPTTVTVTTSFTGKGLAPPLTGTYAMSSSSTVPMNLVP